MARSISFVLEGEVRTRISVTENGDGSLTFDLKVLGGGSVGDLRGLFFDLNGLVADDKLTAYSTAEYEGDVTGAAYDEGSVDRVSRDANVKGAVTNELGDFDVGIEFGTSGMSADDIQSTAFVLDHSEVDLTLDMLDLSDFGIRYTSVGEEGGERTSSLKLGGQASGVADNDALGVDENASNAVNLLANDTAAGNSVTGATGADGSAFAATAAGYEQVVVVDGRTLGTLRIAADGTATFDADGADVDSLVEGETVSFTVTYHTADAATGSTASADLTVTLTGVNDAAVITGVAAGTVTEDGDGDADATTAQTVSGVLSVADADAGEAALQPVAAGTAGTNGYGSFQVQADGSWTYTLDNDHADVQALAAGATLTDSIVVTSLDGTASETVTVTIAGTNDAATIAGTASGTVTEDGDGDADPTTAQTVTGALSVADIDTGQAALQALAAGTAGANGYGSFEVQANGSWTYTLDNDHADVQALAAGATLTDSVLVSSADGSATETISVTITGTNDAPVAVADSVATDEDTAITFDVLGNDSDVDGDALGLAGLSGATSSMGAAISINAGGQIVYDPTGSSQLQALQAGQNAVDTFSYTVSDGQGGTSTATVSVAVAGVADGGAVNDVASTNEDQRIFIDVLANDISANGKWVHALSDSDGSTPGYQTAQGATISIIGGQIFYDPQNAPALQALETGQSVVDTFTYTMRDGSGNLTEATVEVTVGGSTEGAIIESGITATMGFNAPAGAPLSYTENGMTVQSFYTSGPHLHMTGTALYNHEGCCSTPYEFRYYNPDNTDNTFSLVSLQNVYGDGHFYAYRDGVQVGSQYVSGSGTVAFNAGFQNVDVVRWSENSGSHTIDNLVFTA